MKLMTSLEQVMVMKLIVLLTLGQHVVDVYCASMSQQGYDEEKSMMDSPKKKMRIRHDRTYTGSWDPDIPWVNVKKTQPPTSKPREKPRHRQTSEEPQIAEAIGNVTVSVGREAVMHCIVKHLGKNKVGWMKLESQTILSLDKIIITENPRIYVTHDERHTWSLHIRQVHESDRGCYMCQVNSPDVNLRTHGCLDVHVPPDIVTSAENSELTVGEGQAANLTCEARGYPSPKISWKRQDGRVINVYDDKGEYAPVMMTEGASLVFRKVSREDMGNYICIATNDVPPARSFRFSLNVQFVPSVKLPVVLVGAAIGAEVMIDCYIEAHPAAVTYWLRNESDVLVYRSGKYDVTDEKDGFRTASHLKIKNFSRNDIGSYSCVAGNSLGRRNDTVRVYEVKLTEENLPLLNLCGVNKNRMRVFPDLKMCITGEPSKTTHSIPPAPVNVWEMPRDDNDDHYLLSAGVAHSRGALFVFCVFLFILAS